MLIPPPEIRHRIVELRKAKGVTQEEMADALGVSRQTIISIEQERYKPSFTLAWQIAEYFELPLLEVFYADRSVNANGAKG